MPALPGHRPPLLLELDLTELPAAPDADDPLARLRARGRHQLRPTLRALHDAGADRHVVGLIAKVGGALPWAAMQELRLAVRAFAASGKPTLAWAETFGEGSGGMAGYVLATGFDQIWLQPSGGLGLLGVGVETTFVRGALDHLGIEPQIEQRHEYKNAADRLMRTEFTEAHRTALDRLAESIFTEAVAAIASGRKLDAARVRRTRRRGAAHRAGGPRCEPGRPARLPRRGVRRDACDRRRRCRVAVRRPVASTPAPARCRRAARATSLSSRRAVRSCPGGRGAVRWGARSAAIRSGRRCAPRRTTTTFAPWCCMSTHPGGSAVASDTIWREVCRVRDAGKPVVVSMGAAAASGGYYIACPADVIVALPSTLTGSIGVFGGKTRRPRTARSRGPDHRSRVARSSVADVLGSPRLHRRRAGAVGRHHRRDLRRLRRQSGRGPRHVRSPRSRPSPAGGSGPEATRSASAWSTSSAACATPCGSPARARACPRTPRCAIRSTSRRWPGSAERRTARTHERWQARRFPACPTSPRRSACRPRPRCGCRRSRCAEAGPQHGISAARVPAAAPR